uniref:C2 domain-containing protein n=1 Tax=Panagrellus redivivus TaxID=6233 RepID=A0A7E4VKQ3_PANRE
MPHNSAPDTRDGSIGLESQLLIGGAVLVALVAAVTILAVSRRKKRLTREFSSPLIATAPLGGLKANGIKAGAPSASAFRKSPIQSPAGSDGTTSPQCVPLTPSYSSMNVTTNAENVQPARLRSNGAAAAAELGPDRGTLTLSLQYDPSSAALQIGIIKCEGLPELTPLPASAGQCKLDPYVKVRVMPENQHRMKTRVLKGTKDPNFDEIFTVYGLAANKLREHSLHLAVLAFDRYSRDTILGEIIYPLGATDDLINNNERRAVTLALRGRDEVSETRGEALISMAYNRQSNSINFALMKMKDLPKDSTMGLADPYAKIYMLYNGQRMARHKTHVKKKATDPVFNESFAFELPAGHTTHDLDKISFEVLVLNKDGVTRNELIGQVHLDCGAEQWVSCRAQPGKQVAEWHRIIKF